MLGFSSSPSPSHHSKTVSFGNSNIGPYYWVGHCHNGVDYYAGQTFQIPEKGVLQKIKLYCSLIQGSPHATLSIYDFDEVNHIWKSKRNETIKTITPSFENQWIEFEIQGIEVHKGECYGFKLTCQKGGMMALAECPWDKPNPYAEGEEWVGSSSLPEGKFQKEFDFAFQGEIDISTKTQFL